ncbi:MAG: STAS domain-containing protein [Capsulimonadales bacterium]|nr:STAS domain-containing protein [Capsulimonadales bacterium]
MEIEVSETEAGIPLIRILGEIDLHTCPELRSTLQTLIEQGRFCLVLDMASVPYVDSAALGVLVDAQRRTREKGGEVFLARITSFVLRAFEITRLIRIFRVFESVNEAVEAARATCDGDAPV